jgi:hypothetical protein
MHVVSKTSKPLKVSFALLKKLCRSMRISFTLKLKKKKRQSGITIRYGGECPSDDYLYPLLTEEPAYTITTTDLTRPIRLDLLPSEIMLKITTLVTTTDLLSLKRSTNHIRSLIDTHANWIANEFIRINYMTEAKLLKSKFQNGWLIPTIPSFRSEELRLEYARQKQVNPPASRVWEGLGQTLPVTSELTKPGPQYLLFLMENSRDILVFWDMITPFPSEVRTELDATDTQPTGLEGGEAPCRQAEVESKMEHLDSIQLRAFEERIRLYCAKKTLQKLDWLAYESDLWDPWARRRRHVETAEVKKLLGWYYD